MIWILAILTAIIAIHVIISNDLKYKIKKWLENASYKRMCARDKYEQRKREREERLKENRGKRPRRRFFDGMRDA